MNKQKGNMYPFVTHTWNPIKGKCPHDCIYCYMKVYSQPELYLDKKALDENLGQGNFIFVGSSTDMWADDVPSNWIIQTLDKCKSFDNRYLFQSKNPERFNRFNFPLNTIIGTTIETNRFYASISNAPIPYKRKQLLTPQRLPKMVSIEPIMDFDLDILVDWVKEIKPEFVSIGADSKGHNLPEPSPKKLKALIENLKPLTTVKLKNNLSRLY